MLLVDRHKVLVENLLQMLESIGLCWDVASRLKAWVVFREDVGWRVKRAGPSVVGNDTPTLAVSFKLKEHHPRNDERGVLRLKGISIHIWLIGWTTIAGSSR